MATDVGMQLAVSLVQLVLGIGLSMGTIFVAFKMFARLTYHNIDLVKELNAGNAAVGILLVGVILSLALLVESGVASVTRLVTPNASVTIIFIALVVGVLNLLISVIVSMIAIAISVRVLDFMTMGVSEMQELRKGNVAVALMMAGVVVAVSFVIKGAIGGVLHNLDVVDILGALGL